MEVGPPTLHPDWPRIPGSLTAFEDRFDPVAFFRASRRHIINLNSIRSTESDPAGNLVVTMRCGQTVPLSRRQFHSIEEGAGILAAPQLIPLH